MPKVIKKKAPKKKPVKVQDEEVKSAAHETIEKLRARQKQLTVGGAVIAGIIILYIIVSMYSSSVKSRAYALEAEGLNVYYSAAADSQSDEDRWKRALALFQESTEIKMTPTVQYYVGNCYANLKDYENAVAAYNTFIENFPGETLLLPLVYQKLADVYVKSNQNDLALAALDKLAALEKGIFKDTALILQARYLDGAGEKEKALEKYAALVDIFPNSPWGGEANAKIASATEAPPEEQKDVKEEAAPAEETKEQQPQ